MDIIALILLLAAYAALSSRRVVEALRRFYDHRFHGGLLVAMLIVPYLLATLPGAPADPQGWILGVLIMLAYLLVPGLALLFAPPRRKGIDVFDVIAIAAIWFPIEFDWLPEPAGDLVRLVPLVTGIVLGFVLFLVIRPAEGLGYTYLLRARDIGYALLAYLAYGVIGVPLGVAMGFIQPDFASFDALQWLSRFAMIYFFNALPEELLFRGIIQNLIEQRFGRTWVTLIAASVIFGLAHLNNSTEFHRPPNGPYVIMATLAGIAYGWSWRKSEKITGSAITHTLVNFVWGVVFNQG